jgi:hypothetical protein
VVAGATEGGGTEYSRIPIGWTHRSRQQGQLPPLVRDWVPDNEGIVQWTHPPIREPSEEEDAAVAGVNHGAVAVGSAGRVEGTGRDESGGLGTIVHEAKHGGRAVEFFESAAEAGVGDDAAPALADEGGAEKALGVVGREAEQYPLDHLIQQSWRRQHAARWTMKWIQRGFGAGLRKGRARGEATEAMGTERNCQSLIRAWAG